jgi:pyruvate formate lyase activating enzyme
MDSGMIKGYVDLSTVDWDGRVAAVLFTGGCNLLCRYCHNASLVLKPDEIMTLPYGLIKGKILDNKDFINGIVITGGEPTIWNYELAQLIADLKGDTGLDIKLDTNGTDPYLLKELLEAEMIDYVALDIKTSLTEQLTAVTQVPHMYPLVIRSIEVLRDYLSPTQYEFRTTVLPCYHNKQQLLNIARTFDRGEKWKLQNFRGSDDMIVPEMKTLRPYSDEYIHQLQMAVNEILSEE